MLDSRYGFLPSPRFWFGDHHRIIWRSSVLSTTGGWRHGSSWRTWAITADFLAIFLTGWGGPILCLPGIGSKSSKKCARHQWCVMSVTTLIVFYTCFIVFFRSQGWIAIPSMTFSTKEQKRRTRWWWGGLVVQSQWRWWGWRLNLSNPWYKGIDSHQL
jgi:hypothetical protein